MHLSAKERDHLRSGMRTYLESTQAILGALAEGKLSAVADNARKAGTRAVHDVPVSTAVKLPLGFISLGMDTHQRFDALALVASQTGSRREVLQHFSDILANCVACHATYRVLPE